MESTDEFGNFLVNTVRGSAVIADPMVEPIGEAIKRLTRVQSRDQSSIDKRRGLIRKIIKHFKGKHAPEFHDPHRLEEMLAQLSWADDVLERKRNTRDVSQQTKG